MKTTAFCSIVAVTVFCCAALAQAASVSLGVNMTAYADAGDEGRPDKQHYGDGFNVSVTSHGVDEPTLSQELSHGLNGNVSGTFSGPVYQYPFGTYTYEASAGVYNDMYSYAGFGVVRLSTNGSVLTVTNPIQNDGIRQADANAYDDISGQFQDSLLFIGRRLPDGRIYRIHAKVRLSGEWTANVNASTDPNSQGYGDQPRAAYTLKIEGTGVPTGPYGGWYAYTLIQPNENFSTNNPPPSSISLNFPVTSGAYNNISYYMEIAGAEHVNADGAGAYVMDLSHSLVWDGIDYVTDDTTGEIVTDWTITSESGVDYSHPLSDVPEPSGFGIAALGCLVLFTAGRARQARSML
jgi:hypothetical protein